MVAFDRFVREDVSIFRRKRQNVKAIAIIRWMPVLCANGNRYDAGCERMMKNPKKNVFVSFFRSHNTIVKGLPRARSTLSRDMA